MRTADGGSGRASGADDGLRLRLADWREVVALAPGGDRAAVVEDLGAELAVAVERVILRRAVDEAVRRRADHWREWSRDASPSGGGEPEVRGRRARLQDDADAAHERLLHTVERMRTAQDDDVEPAATAAVPLTGPDLATGCHAAGELLGHGAVLDTVLASLRRVEVDRDVLRTSLAGGAEAGPAVAVARALADFHWWPRSLREGALAVVAGGRPLSEVMSCLNALAFTPLTVAQHRAALAMMAEPDSPYGLDGTAIAAALLGVTLVRCDPDRAPRRTRVFTAERARPSDASTRTSA